MQVLSSDNQTFNLTKDDIEQLLTLSDMSNDVEISTEPLKTEIHPTTWELILEYCRDHGTIRMELKEDKMDFNAWEVGFMQKLKCLNKLMDVIYAANFLNAHGLFELITSWISCIPLIEIDSSLFPADFNIQKKIVQKRLMITFMGGIRSNNKEMCDLAINQGLHNWNELIRLAAKSNSLDIFVRIRKNAKKRNQVHLIDYDQLTKFQFRGIQDQVEKWMNFRKEAKEQGISEIEREKQRKAQLKELAKGWGTYNTEQLFEELWNSIQSGKMDELS